MDSNAHEVIQYHFASGDYRFHAIRLSCAWDDSPAIAAPPTYAEVAETIAPWVDFCIEQFGPQRCMFESNFPVDKVSYPYATIWNAFQRLTAAYTPDEKAALFHDTACRAYKLDEIRRYSC